jgi:hypothetical protein
MNALTTIRRVLTDPRVRDMDTDGDDRIDLHRSILTQKKMMKGVFLHFYDLFVDYNTRLFSGDGKLVELGSGAGFVKEVVPNMVVTDVVAAPGLDMVLDSQDMDLQDGSVRAILGINCFHHFSDPDAFFGELQRVLVRGGGCVLIEPYHGVLARPFYRNLHDGEHFNMSQDSWRTQGESGAMTNANQALSYMVFVRDRARFDREYPGLEIVEVKTISNYLQYLLSGGLNFRQLVPNALIGTVKLTERLLRPMESLSALHHVIVLRKRS